VKLTNYCIASVFSWCTLLGLAKEMPLRGADFIQILRPNAFLIRCRHGAAAFFLQVWKLCIDLNPTHWVHILVYETYRKFARKNEMLALGVCFQQMLSASLPPQHHIYLWNLPRCTLFSPHIYPVLHFTSYSFALPCTCRFWALGPPFFLFLNGNGKTDIKKQIITERVLRLRNDNLNLVQ